MGGQSNRRRLAVTISVLSVAAGAVTTYLGISLGTPVPSTKAAIIDGFERSFTIEEVAIPWPEQPAAVGILGNETIRTNGNETMTPMGSITKLVPVLVSMEYKPYDKNDSSEYLLTQRDAQYLSEVLRDDASTGPIRVGESVTRYEMLQQIFLPSANNYVLAYRDWIFGSNEVFLAETEKWFTKHGLKNIVVDEPTGLRPANTKSSAHDLVRIAMIALEYPVLAEIAAQKTATIEGIGSIESANPLINDPGVRGLKTGSVRESATKDTRNIIVVRDVTFADRTITFIAVALGQPNPEARISVGRQLANSIDANIQEIEVAARGETVGTVASWDGRSIDLVISESVSTVLTLDESATRTVKVSPISAGTNAGATVGSVVIETPTGRRAVDVVIAEAIPEPDAWWRLTHPFEVLGWQK